MQSSVSSKVLQFHLGMGEKFWNTLYTSKFVVQGKIITFLEISMPGNTKISNMLLSNFPSLITKSCLLIFLDLLIEYRCLYRLDALNTKNSFLWYLLWGGINAILWHHTILFHSAFLSFTTDRWKLQYCSNPLPKSSNIRENQSGCYNPRYS